MTSSQTDREGIVMTTEVQETQLAAQQPASSQADVNTGNSGTITEPKLCNHPVDQGDGTAKPCQKAENHTGDHSTRKYSRVDTSVVTDDLLSAFDEETPDELQADIKVTESGGPKTPQEHQVVEHLKTVHANWIKAGRKPNFNDPANKAIRGKYRVTPETEAAVRKLLKSMGNHLEIHVRIAPVVRLTDGTYRLPWLAVDRAPKAPKKADKPAAETAQPTLAQVTAAGEAALQALAGGPEKPAEAPKPTAPKPQAPKR